ncbi:MAG TPA: hypothetical protein VK452_10820 [Dissulfurispiraceae bacterium]|nr:hypothetical protein [Dissulfurispiraceae bacterium]
MMIVPRKVCLASALMLFTVVAIMLSGCGQKGRPTMRSFEKPAPVSGMTAIHKDGKVTISWSYVKQAKIVVKGFYVERAEGNAPFNNLAFVPADITHYDDEKFDSGKEYRYRIRVYSLRNMISDASQELKVDPVRPPDPPGDLTYRLTDDAIDITWRKVDGGVSYNIYRGTDREKCNGLRLNAEPLKSAFFRDSVTVNQVVYYSVSSIIMTNLANEGDSSKCLIVDPHLFVPVQPSDVRFARAEGKVYISWKENSEKWLKGYRVYRKSESGEFVPVADVEIPSFVDEVPLHEVVSYRIAALGPFSESSLSEPVRVNPNRR